MKKLLAMVLSLMLMLLPVLSLAASPMEVLMSGKALSGKVTFTVAGLEEMLQNVALTFSTQLSDKLVSTRHLIIDGNDILSCSTEVNNKEIIITSNVIGNQAVGATYDEILKVVNQLVDYLQAQGLIPEAVNVPELSTSTTLDLESLNLDALNGLVEVFMGKMTMDESAEVFDYALYFEDDTITEEQLPTQQAAGHFGIIIDSELVSATCDALKQFVADNEALASSWNEDTDKALSDTKAFFEKLTAPVTFDVYITEMGMPVAITVACADESLNFAVKGAFFADDQGVFTNCYGKAWKNKEAVGTLDVATMDGAVDVLLTLFNGDNPMAIDLLIDAPVQQGDMTLSHLKLTAGPANGVGQVYTVDYTQGDSGEAATYEGYCQLVITDSMQESPLFTVYADLAASDEVETAIDRGNVAYPLSMTQDELSNFASELGGNALMYLFSILQYLPEDVVNAVMGMFMGGME